jgi:hypothetical protein
MLRPRKWKKGKANKAPAGSPWFLFSVDFRT